MRHFFSSIWHFLKTHKFIFLLIIILIVISGFAINGYLYANFLVGNDMIIKLSSDKEVMYLSHGGSEEIKYAASIKTNPFCSATCKSTFIDISNNKEIDSSEFTLRSGLPLNKEYSIKSPEKGTGEYLYRFNLECSSSKTFWCHTSGEATIRSILTIVNYDLTTNEKAFKSKLKLELSQKISDLESINGRLSFQKDFTNQSAVDFGLSDELNSLSLDYQDSVNAIKDVLKIWYDQDYTALSNNLPNIDSLIKNVKSNSDVFSEKLSNASSKYNLLITSLDSSGKELENLTSSYVQSVSALSNIDDSITEHNNAVNYFGKKNSLNDKESALVALNLTMTSLRSSLSEEIRLESLQKDIDTNIEFDSVCKIKGYCVNHSDIIQLATLSDFDLNNSCEGLSLANNYYDSFSIDLSAYPNASDFWNEIDLRAASIKTIIAADYLANLPQDGANYEILRQFLEAKTNFAASADTNTTIAYGNATYDISNALIWVLKQQKPSECTVPNYIFGKILAANFTKIDYSEDYTSESINVSVEEPLPKCCLFGKCESCRNIPNNYPIIFLHGHAISVGTSVEYSLDAFNKMQIALEKEGYLNVGAISMYTKKNTPNIWAELPIPLSIKVSYYYDSFQQQEDYVLVQTKSENIDTYAVRLKEILDTVFFKTGKDKVIIIANSMGGLVARRYIQLFGENNVDKLIMIGTPNKGIVGATRNYCQVVGGEALECRDMDADSVFIKKLNSGPVPKIPVYMIVGIGCNMKEGDGDGIVLKDHAILDFATNYFVSGTCQGIDFMHPNMIDVNKYPEVYQDVKEILANSSSQAQQ